VKTDSQRTEGPTKNLELGFLTQRKEWLGGFFLSFHGKKIIKWSSTRDNQCKTLAHENLEILQRRCLQNAKESSLQFFTTNSFILH